MTEPSKKTIDKVKKVVKKLKANDQLKCNIKQYNSRSK